MKVFKRGSVYWFELVFNGQRIQRSTKSKNERIAGQIMSVFHTALVKGEVGITERKKIPSFKIAMGAFLEWFKTEHEDHPATHRRYLVSSSALLRHFKDMQLDKVTPDEVEAFKMDRKNQFKTVRGKDKRKVTNKKIQPATVNRELACLRAMFNYAIKADGSLKNPISKAAVRAYREDNEQTRVLTYSEQEKYLAAATPMLRDVATLMLETGMRPEEVYRIEPKNVHLAEDYLFNPHGKTKAAKRRIKLTSPAKSVLARRMKDCGSFLFPCERKSPTDAMRPVPKVNNAHDRAVRNSKIAPCRLYDLRHTWATRAAEAGIDLVTLAAMLGHSRINMVLRYAHPTQEHQTKAMEKMERFVAQQQIEAAAKRQGISEMAIQ